VAAIGDPMQVVVAAMAVAASEQGGVLLAGGTQMLAVYALIRKLAPDCHLERIAVGTTGWVSQDPSADAVGLATDLTPAIFFSAQMRFAHSGYEQLQVYDRGFVKEGVGAGGAAIAAALYQDWNSSDVLRSTEKLLSAMLQ
jgi:NaMN:DMB phosphoribosyltransferase